MSMAGNGNGNGKMGRPSKLTPEIVEEMVALHEEGIFADNDIAESVGISHDTYINWMNRGAKAKSGEYLEFYERMCRARARGNITAAREVWKTTKGKLHLLKCHGYVFTDKIEAEVEHSGVVSTLHIHPTERVHQLAEAHSDDDGGEEGE